MAGRNVTGPLFGFLALILCFVWGISLFFKAWTVFWIFLILCLVSLTVFASLHFKEFVHFFVSRQLRYGTNVALSILGVLGIAVFVNVIVAQRFDERIDLTESRINSLSEQTKEILKKLDKDVHIIAFFSDENSRLALRAKEMLELYQHESKLITVSFKNPYIDTLLSEKYDLKYDGSIIFESKDRIEKVTTVDEPKFTSAILKIIRNETEKLYFLTEHGEHGIDNYDPKGYANLRTDLESQNYDIRSLSLLKQTDIPRDCDVLVIAGPKNRLTENEINLIEKYLTRNGKLLLLLNPSVSADDVNGGLVQLMKKWGVVIGNDLVIDRQRFFRLPGELFVALDLEFQPHAITYFSMRASIPFLYTRSVTPLEERRSDLIVKSLAKTSSPIGISWGETQRKIDGSFNTETYTSEVDTPGPVSVAVAVEEENNNNTEDMDSKNLTRMVIFGDSDFATNAFLRQPNRDLFLATVNWLTEDEDLIAIRPIDLRKQVLRRMTIQEARLVQIISVFLIPIIVFIAGMVVWWLRREGGTA